MAQIKHLTNGIDVAIFGDGERPFVIIPGINVTQIMGAANLVEKMYEGVFSEGYKTYLIDRREEMPEGYTVEDMAKDCAEAMVELGIKKACIFGASQGGMITQVIAAKYPELVDKIVIGSSAYRQTKMSVDTFSEMLRLAMSGDYEATNREIFRRIHPKYKLEANAEAFKELEKVGTKKEFEHFIIMTKAALNYDGTKYLPELEKIKDRILTIGDWDDYVFSGEASEDMAEKIGCAHYMYSGFGHTVYDNAPDYQYRMREFFEK